MRRYRLFEVAIMLILCGVVFFPTANSWASVKLSGNKLMSCTMKETPSCVPNVLLIAEKNACKDRRKECYDYCKTMVPGYKDLCVLSCKDEYKVCRAE